MREEGLEREEVLEREEEKGEARKRRLHGSWLPSCRVLGVLW